MILVEQLHQGNTRANRDRIARWVGTDTSRFRELIQIYLTGDLREAQLAAGVLFCCLENHPDLFTPWMADIVTRMGERDIHPAVRRVALRAFMDREIPARLQGRVLDACFRFLADPSEPIAIRVFSMGTIARLARSQPDIWRELLQTIEAFLPSSTPAFRAHARKVMRQAKKHGIEGYGPPRA